MADGLPFGCGRIGIGDGNSSKFSWLFVKSWGGTGFHLAFIRVAGNQAHTEDWEGEISMERTTEQLLSCLLAESGQR